MTADAQSGTGESTDDPRFSRSVYVAVGLAFTGVALFLWGVLPAAAVGGSVLLGDKARTVMRRNVF